MAAGFTRKETRSTAGRLIKPTPKVRDIMCESLRVAVDDAFNDVSEGINRLTGMMKNEENPTEVDHYYQQWLLDRNELNDLIREVDLYLPSDDLAVYHERQHGMAQSFPVLEQDVALYTRGKVRVTSDDRREPTLEEAEMESADIDAKIQEMQAAISTMQLSTRPVTAPRPPVAPTAPGPATSSTPRDPPLPPPPPPNVSRVPSSTTVDATASAIDRLANILIGKQTGDSGGRLPKIEPDVFKGDLTAFPAWWNAFETMVETRARTNKERLFYLNKYTAGPANECVKGFLGLYTDDGAYRRARNVLQTRFGNRLRIAEAFKAKLTAWGAIKDGDGESLQAYADFLWQCHAAMDSLDYLTNLNCQEENVKLANKLPKKVIERWDRMVDDVMFGDELDVTEEPSGDIGHFPSFQEFCRFVSREARIQVGSCMKTTPSSNGNQRRKSTAMSTTTAPKTDKKPGDPCEFCQGSHMLYQCDRFLANRAEFKRQFARDKGLCFGCLRRSHVYRQCRIRNAELMREPEGFRSESKPARTTAMMTMSDDGAGCSSTVLPVWLYMNENPGQKILVYALLDSQSSSCFITTELTERLQLEVDPVKLELTTLGSKRCVNSGIVGRLRVQSEEFGQSIALPSCYTRSVIPGNLQHVPRPELVARWPHMSDVAEQLKPPRPEIPFGLLIGFNCSEATCTEEYRRGHREQPYASRSVLGWTVTGCLTAAAPTSLRCMNLQTRVREINSDQIQLAFDQGFESPEAGDARVLSQDDELFMRRVENEMVLTDEGYFQVPLPFREDPIDLPDSRPMAYKRLMSVKNRMKKDAGFKTQFGDFMAGLVSKGQAERVTSPDVVPVGSRWYWPVHGVVHPRKPGKIRGVMDGAAEVHGVSINSRLLTGPDQINNLVGVLGRFRRERVAVTCDIEGMFLQVRVAEKYRDYLRFLWFADGDPDGQIVEYRMCVNVFGAASSPATSALALKRTADMFEEQYGSAAADFVRDDFYVDDGLGATVDDDSALELIHNSRSLCAAGGFNLHKFASSSRAVMAKIPVEWRAPSLQNLAIHQEHLPNERALGLLLSLEEDALLYIVTLMKKADTRRGYLSSLSSVFDPLGLISPTLLPGRLLLQALCSRKFGWDDPVEEEVEEAWRLWYGGLTELKRLSVPRCVRRTVELPVTRVELHTFADASSKGYGACCYLLVADDAGHVDTTLVYAKARVAPSKATTVPRLELQAAVLAVKMGEFMRRELRYADLKTRYWSDSMVVLGYISNESRRFHVYVANRSQYIRTHTSSSQWRHIPTAQNPADLASRGASATELVDSQLWWSGPAEIRDAQATTLEQTEVNPDDPELKKTALTLTTRVKPTDDLLSSLTRYSRWYDILSIVGACLRFKTQALGQPRESPVQLMQRAQTALIRLVQEGAFGAELAVLEEGEYPATVLQQRERKRKLKPSSNLYRLDVFRDSAGVLRVGGRLRRSGLPLPMVHPAVLPGSHRLTALLIRHYHEKGGHMGVVTTLNSVRQAGFWVLSGRASAGGVVTTCVTCRRKRGTVGEQHMADLPADRFDRTAPFTYVAADMFGPFLIRQARSQIKWWICIFVCMASRAVHLEPVSAMDVSGFLQAYRRMVARRGPVRAIRCDRGTNFTGAANELERAWTESEKADISGALKKRGCDVLSFKFNYPKASHMAGSWERMIRTVRSAFWETQKNFGASMSYEVFSTMTAEAEALVNSRPITAVDMTDDTTPAALTPAQLLTLKPETIAPPPGEFVSEDRYARKRWRTTQYLVNQFWRRWVRDYALSQQKREKWNRPRNDFREDDVVLLVEPDAPRGKWPLARVTSVARSDDDMVRKVTVKTESGQLDRPIQKLVLIYRPEEDRGAVRNHGEPRPV